MFTNIAIYKEILKQSCFGYILEGEYKVLLNCFDFRPQFYCMRVIQNWIMIYIYIYKLGKNN